MRPTNPFTKARWSTYLRQLTESQGVSKSVVARALELPESRVASWLAQSRVVTPQTAFEVGERLRDQLSLESSGPEALYACGYFADLFEFLKHLSLDGANGGNTLAVKMFCWLPGSFVDLEYKLILAQQKCLAEEHWNRAMLRNVREWFRFDLDFILAEFHRTERLNALRPIGEELRSPEVRPAVLEAWKGVQRRILRMTSRPPRHGVSKTTIWGRTIETRYTAYDDDFNREIENAAVDAIRDVAKQWRSEVPSFCAPRLWRMLVEWACHVDEKAYAEMCPLLPHFFRSYEGPELTEAERKRVLWVEHQRDQYKG